MPLPRIRALLLAACTVALPACDGADAPTPPPDGPVIIGFTADRPSYWVGEQARLTVQFSGGTGRLEPDGIPVASGQTVTTPLLSLPMEYRLVVEDGASSVARSLHLAVRYRDRFRTVPMPFARSGHRAVGLADGRVLIIGGEDGRILPGTVQAFDPVTETFAVFAQLATGRSEFIAQPLYSGEILVAGGLRAAADAPQAEILDTVTGTVTATHGPPHRDRTHAAATLLMDGRAFIAGGQVDAVPDDTVEIYDPATRTFSLLPGRLQVPRLQHRVARIDEHRVLVVGGSGSGPVAPPAEIYDLQSGTSTLVPTPDVMARIRPLVITLPDGGMLVIGGEEDDQQPLATVVRFDPASARLDPFATLSIPRAAAAVERLVDGRVLVAGGTTGLLSSAVTATTELLDATARRSDGPSMATPRRDHSMTRLGNGKVVVLGGLGADLTVLNSAEIYE